MKRFFVLSLMAVMFVATLTTSCSMQSMTFKNLEKKGYIVGQLTPAQQQQIAPLLLEFPSFGLTAEAYVASDYSISYLYQGGELDWRNYADSLVAAGFSKIGNGYVKADRKVGISYNVAYKVMELSNKSYILVTFTSAVLS